MHLVHGERKISDSASSEVFNVGPNDELILPSGLQANVKIQFHKGPLKLLRMNTSFEDVPGVPPEWRGNLANLPFGKPRRREEFLVNLDLCRIFAFASLVVFLIVVMKLLQARWVWSCSEDFLDTSL